MITPSTRGLGHLLQQFLWSVVVVNPRQSERETGIDVLSPAFTGVGVVFTESQTGQRLPSIGVVFETIFVLL